MDAKDSKFMRDIEKRIENTIKKFKLFTKKDKIGVAVSGGKDSTVCLYVLKKLGYNMIGVTVDAVIGNYTKQNLENLRKTCKKYGIKLEEISFKDEFGHSLCYLKSLLHSKGNEIQSCALCGVLRKYLLNKYARKLKLDCIATGHKLDDEYLIDDSVPTGMCSWAFYTLFPFITALKSGGAFPWEKDRDTTTVACPDADNPVVFELSRIK